MSKYHHSLQHHELIMSIGEDYVLTSHMGVAYSSGMSKNGSWDSQDADVADGDALGKFRGGGAVSAPFVAVASVTSDQRGYGRCPQCASGRGAAGTWRCSASLLRFVVLGQPHDSEE